VDDQLSIGASALLTYADLEQNIFPGTSVNNPEQLRQQQLHPRAGGGSLSHGL
jgi:hypothetical protein